MLSSWQLGGQDLAGELQFAYPCLAAGRAGVRTLFCEPGGPPDQISSRCVQSLGVVPPAGSAQSVSKVNSSWDAHAQPCSWEEAASSGSVSRKGGPCSALISWEDPKPLRASVSPSVKWGLAENPLSGAL